MIIDTSQGDIEVVGDIKEFKTSIDPKNLEFITTLLSSNLYSDPEQSFIREIVSNAWDSHVEAGTTDTPVIIRFGKDSVTIRDFGVGLSPERFQEVYCNIGSSTKRESNDYLGGFGIGKYSALACSNTAYITSYYESTAYYYVMVKSGNSITTNLLMEKPTNEKNGVEVTIKNIRDLEPYNRALQFITFFPNVYIYNAKNADIINTVKLKRFNNFAAASMIIPSKLLLGNVLYPCNKYHLNGECRDFLYDIEMTGIVIKFDVGEINITPNRENIIYSSDTIKKIENRIIEAKKELNALVLNRISNDYDNIEHYFKAINDIIEYNPITDSITDWSRKGGYKVVPRDMTQSCITYKGIDLIDSLSVLRLIFNLNIPRYKGVIYDDKMMIKRLHYKVQYNGMLKSNKILILNSDARLIPALKLYLRENYDEYGIMNEVSEQEFIDYIDKLVSWPNTIQNKDLIIKGVFEALVNKAKKLDVTNDAGYLQYKKSLIADKSVDAKEIRESILYVFNNHRYKDKVYFKRFSEVVAYIKSLKKGVLLTNMDASESAFSAIANIKGYVFIKARKDIVSDLRNAGLKCLVDIDWVTKKDPLLSVTKAIIQGLANKDSVNRSIDKSDIEEISETVPDELRKEFNKIAEIMSLYNSNYSYVYLANSENVKADSHTTNICKQLKYHLDKYREATDFVKKSAYGIGSCDLLTTAVVIKTRAYRVNYKTYNKYKNNKLIKVLCKK